MKRFEWLFLALFLGAPWLVEAAPAPWYKWRSVSTGDTVCAQTSPGDGWIKLDRTYVDPRCYRQDRSADDSKEKSKK